MRPRPHIFGAHQLLLGLDPGRSPGITAQAQISLRKPLHGPETASSHQCPQLAGRNWMLVNKPPGRTPVPVPFTLSLSLSPVGSLVLIKISTTTCILCLIHCGFPPLWRKVWLLNYFKDTFSLGNHKNKTNIPIAKRLPEPAKGLWHRQMSRPQVWGCRASRAPLSFEDRGSNYKSHKMKL